jgi:predicted Zn-dependent protease
MVRSGYDPQGAVQVQEFFYRTLEGGAEPMWLTGLFRSHPFSKERMEANEAYIRANYPQNAGLNLGGQVFRQAIAPLVKVQPGYELYDEGRRLESEGDLSAAITTYLQAADRAPDEALIRTALGLTYLKAGDVGSARLHLSKAVGLDGGYYQSRMGYGYALLELDRAGEAVPHLEKSMELLPTLQGAYLLATGYEKTGRTGEARQLYQAVVEADSKGRLGQAAAARLKALGAP